jgi:hypothetical protein
MYGRITNKSGGREVKRLTKVSIFFILIFIITTVYAFAAIIGHHVNSFSDPLYLLILGVMMLCVGHFISQVIDE